MSEPMPSIPTQSPFTYPNPNPSASPSFTQDDTFMPEPIQPMPTFTQTAFSHNLLFTLNILILHKPTRLKEKYEIWAMKMEYWIQNADHNLWRIVQQGNSPKRLGKDAKGNTIVHPPVSLDEHVAVQRENKVRTLLLQALPEDHMPDFHHYDDARDIWMAVKARFGGNEESKKMKKTMLKQQFAEFSVTEEERLFISCFGALKTKEVALIQYSLMGPYETEVTWNLDVRIGHSYGVKVAAAPTHSAFIGTACSGSKPTYSDQQRIVPSLSQTPGRSDNVMECVLHSFVAENEQDQDMIYEDFDQVDQLEMEEMDLKWQMAMLSLRINRFEKKDSRKIELQTDSSNDKSSDSETHASCASSLKTQTKDIPPPVDIQTLPESDLEDPNSTTGSLSFSCSENVKSPRIICNKSGVNNRKVCKNNFVRVKKCFVCGSKLHLIKDCDFYNCVDSVPCKSKAASVSAGSRISPASVPAGRSDSAASRNRPAVHSAGSRISPASVPAGRSDSAASRNRPAVHSAGAPNHAGWSKRPATVSAGRPGSAGWLNPAARPYFRPSSVYFNTPTNLYDPMFMDKGRWDTAGDPSTDNDIGIVDSGCSRSMTGNKEKLADFVPIKGGIVKFGGGDGRISGKGTIRTSKLDFENVYYVEELQHFNLFSVSQICDKKNKVLFTDTDCLVLSEEFQLPDASQVVLRIPRKHDLYTFHISHLQPEQKVTCLVAKASLDESTRWHRRMAHVNFKTINKLAKEGLVDGLPLKVFSNEHNCVACNKGKQHKASYKHISAVRFITDTLQLLHMDLFGPTNIRSIDQKYYSLVVTDDFSRFSWTFFLGTKDETFYVLKEFITLIENQLNKKVKGIRCDNGTEFKNAKLIELCGEKGIKRDYSNPRTPQQNGVAERKNRTLIEAARTMLADSKLPTMFWTEAVSTACYVLNSVYTVFKSDTPAGTQETNVDAGTQDHDSYSEVDEHVIVVPSFPSNSFAGPRQACTSAGSDPAGSHPAGSFDPAALDDPAVSTSVSADFIPVHADESTLPPEDDFRCYSYKLSPAVEVNPVPTKRVNTIHPQSQILGDLASPVLTRSRAHKSKFGESAFIGYIQDQQRTNQTDQLHLSVSACFLSQLDQLVYLTHFEDPDWVDANARREQHINQPRQVWNLSLYLMAVHAIETNGFEKQEVWPEESFWFKALCYGRDGLLLGLQVKQLPDVFLSPRQISTFSWKRYSDSDYAGSHEQEADYCGNIFYKNRYVAAATAAPQVVNTAARCTFFLLTDLVSAGRTKIQLLSFSGRLVSAGRTMVLLVVILSAGRLVSAGRTMVLLLWIYAADSYTMLWAILLLFFYAANTSIHAAGLVCAGSIMFLLADLFLLVVTCFCCAQLDIADLLLLIDFLPAGLKKEVEYLIRVKSLLYGFGGHHLQLKQWRTVDFHSILHLPRVKMYHNPIKRYALTHDPPVVFDSLVKQFWATATVRPNAAGSHDLVATIDGREGGEEIPLTHPCLPLLLSAKMLLMRTKLLAEIGSLQNFSLVEPLVFGPEPRPAGYVDPDVLEPIIFGPQPRPSDFVDPDLRNPLSCGPPPRLTTILSPRPLIITYSMEDDTIHGGFHEESHVGPDDAPTPTTDAAGRAEDPTLLTSLSAKLDRFSCSLSADVLPQAAISESAGPSVGADKGKAPMPDLDIPAEFLAEDAQARKRLEEEQASAAVGSTVTG
ncbi:putative ribonuclease H-like domain-containing protein [Tanacetum coccineum]